MAHRKKFNPSERAYFWTAILYMENMRSDWKEVIEMIIQVPFCYIVHDKDEAFADGTPRKPHIHIILAFKNNYAGSYVLRLLSHLNEEGKNAIPNYEIESVINLKAIYDYIIHDTQAAHDDGKHLYDKSERICCNNFDIGELEKLDSIEKERLLTDLVNLVIDQDYTNFTKLYKFVRDNEKFDDERVNYIRVMNQNTGLLERLCKGNYLSYVEIRNEQKDNSMIASNEARKKYYDLESEKARNAVSFRNGTTTKKLETRDENQKKDLTT